MEGHTSTNSMHQTVVLYRHRQKLEALKNKLEEDKQDEEVRRAIKERIEKVDTALKEVEAYRRVVARAKVGLEKYAKGEGINGYVFHI
ncbi:MAG: hypothetical protein GWO20_17535 [Candidatus Korarchaeota archaeon]|nr:hypothetical protein [Candidatus Korarchaeota archaeon]NIU85149.1 hypothetical protein [Candidatus Thorarchaeota archaeon]NIW15201.1 hypothetical protein [Candidatus Thorarchaeota archaeon]NIW53182.1 hypothetical protein [Candidatus Korarchaeota archaeon]